MGLVVAVAVAETTTPCWLSRLSLAGITPPLLAAVADAAVVGSVVEKKMLVWWTVAAAELAGAARMGVPVACFITEYAGADDGVGVDA